MMMDSALMAVKPEIALVIFGMVLLIYGAFRGDGSARVTLGLAFVALAVAAIFLLCPPYGGGLGSAPVVHVFDRMLVQDGFARFVKLILLIASGLSLVMSWSYLREEKLARPEYPVLVLFATLGMMLMVSANDFLALYVGLELQSLALYVLAAFRRDDTKSSEAGLKYFVLGALSSGLILYGISLIYGYAGTTQFAALAPLLGGTPPLGVLFGLVFICAAMAFKVAAVPFHMWAPDVYEGAPTPITAFFAAAPKVAALALFTRILMQPMAGLTPQWQQIIVFTAVASMLVGSFGGLMQGNFKRLMAYSSIANAGYALIGLAIGKEAGIQALLIYLSIYYLNTLGAFGVLLCLRRNGKAVEQISDLSGIAKSNPLFAVAMVIFMFSLAGVPPLAGFLGKYFIFLAAVQAQMVWIAIIGVLSSVIAAFYYLRIIKVMYFDKPIGSLDPLADRGLHAVVGLAAILMLVMIVWPTPIIDSALIAARSLIGG
ncbi:MAG: NADH-quinone oxidoreductase subunit NuoN [Alphaproteobacteria bacterium]|nr:NADH-quinone oxidoreductase subunit NuoN [Alphaproteobacteria bacterium]